MKRQFDEYERDEMRNNPDNYKLGMFYYNPQDPSFIVPKRNKYLGWTFNFANQFTYILLFCLAVIAVFMSYWGK